MRKLLNRSTLCWIALTIGVYAVIAALIHMDIINAYYQITLITIAIDIVLAVSLNLIIGVCGQFSLGHAGFMCIGAYCGAIVTKTMPNLTGLLLGLVVGIVVSALAALVVAIPTLRLKGDYLAIATLGFSEIIRIIVLNLDITNGAAGLTNIPKMTNWTIAYIAIVVSLIIIVNFGRSSSGRACISIREDEIAAEAMGINLTKYKCIAFIIGAALASVAGGLYASYFRVIKPELFNFNKSVDVLIIVVFGGIGSITGSVIAGVLLGLITLALQSFAQVRMILYAVAIVAIMIFRPEGLLGTSEFTFSGLFKRFKKGGVKHVDSNNA
ncbi:MAG: branched-chain amino acid ABC transporter permease [Erysipelotrichales bacterium]|nr:branched-chain amino acid ABC transporter permease [Erysipelotrichales bacterium]